MTIYNYYVIFEAINGEYSSYLTFSLNLTLFQLDQIPGY